MTRSLDFVILNLLLTGTDQNLHRTDEFSDRCRSYP
jgi:hypothetical protein